MGARFQLRCLGTAELRAPNGEPSRFRTRKHLAFLAYLAVEPRLAHRRERLADLLWPRATDSEGRHSVATALSVLRAKFGREAFEADRDHVRFVFSDLDLDLDRLAAGEVLGSEVVPPLEVGSFLGDFEIADAPEFMLWKDQQQARWLPLIRDALIRLIDRRRRTGDFRRIEGLADRMLAIDGLSEEGVRAKMEARAFDGDRLTALKIFEAWKVRLAEELGAAPSDLVEGIAIRLRRRGWERAVRSDIPTVPTDQWKGRTFIGRSAEYRAIYESWEHTVRSEARHALILGDSGIGKSTLIERLMTAAGLEGAATSRVQCYEVEREIPYAAVGGLVQGLLDRAGVSGTPPEWLAELARTVPEVRQRFPSIPPPQESQGETARIRLTESVHQLFSAISEESPVILVVDDVHLADDASVAVLHLLMRRTQSQRIMVLLTARSGELNRSPNAGRLRENQRQLGLKIIELPPMSEDESGQLLGSLLPADEPQPGATARRAVIRAAGGYPMVIELLIRDWQVNGEKCLALSLGAMTTEPGAAIAVEDAYRRILDRLIHELDPTTRNVLNLAAILGGRLNDLGMYGLVDLTVAQTMTGMARLTDLRLLRDGGQELEFRNELIRAQAYLSIPLPVRKALHDNVATRLLGEARQGKQVPGLEIAWHCIRSGRTDEATPYLLSGAREALERGATLEVERALVTAIPNVREPERSEASLLLAEVLQEQGCWKESVKALEQCHFDPHSQNGQLAQIMRISAWRRQYEAKSEEALSAAAELVQSIQASGSTRNAVAAAYTAACILDEVRDRALAKELLEKVDNLIPPPQSEEFPKVLLVKAMLLYQAHETEASLRYISEASAILRKKEIINSWVASLDCGLGVNGCAMGHYEQALPSLTRAYHTALQIGNERLCRTAAVNASLCCGRLGKYKEQLRWANMALESRGKTFEGYAEIHAAYNAAMAHALLGNAQLAIQTIAREEERIPALAPQWMHQAWGLYVADIQQFLGYNKLADQAAERATEGDNEILHSDSFGGPFSRWVARLAIATKNYVPSAERLRELNARRLEFDTKDRVEILSSWIWFSQRTGINIETERQILMGELSMLPDAFGDQLRRLGMLDPLIDFARPPNRRRAPANPL